MANVSINEFKKNRNTLFGLIDCYTGFGFSTRHKQKCNDELKPLVQKAKTEIESADNDIAYYDTATDISTRVDSTDIIKGIQPQMNKINPTILKSIQDIDRVKNGVSGVNPMISRAPPEFNQNRGGKRSRRYNKKSKKTMRRRRGRTYRRK